MKLVDAITNDANQSFTIALDDGNKVPFSLVYKEQQQGWFYSFTYGSVSIKGRRMVNSPNMVRSLRNVLPFGLMCTVSDGLEPILLDDFSTSKAQLYVLNNDDIALVEASL